MGAKPNSALRVILACSTVLGTEAQSIVRRCFERVDVVCWDCVDEDAETAAREFLLRRTFDLAISFYSCFIFRPAELDRIAVPLNIHPALPSLPGWCHELLPVWKGHDSVGVTVHWMSETIDSGRIVEVFEYPLPRERTLESLRRQVYDANLEVLERLCSELSGFTNVDELRRHLEYRSRDTAREWTGVRNTRRCIAELVERTSTPALGTGQ